MSITFTCFAAPRTTVPCEFCAKEKVWADEAGETVFTNDKGGHCSPWCDGTEEVSEAPEANFANGNARSLLNLLGFDSEDLCGSADGATLRQRIFKARNADRSSLVEAPYHQKGGHAGVEVTHEGNVARVQRMGAAVAYFGNTDEQTLRRLANLESIAVWAQDRNLEISWG